MSEQTEKIKELHEDNLSRVFEAQYNKEEKLLLVAV